MMTLSLLPHVALETRSAIEAQLARYQPLRPGLPAVGTDPHATLVPAAPAAATLTSAGTSRGTPRITAEATHADALPRPPRAPRKPPRERAVTRSESSDSLRTLVELGRASAGSHCVIF